MKQSIFITHANQRLSLRQWAKKSGISYSTLYRRLIAGWSDEEALMTKPRVQHMSKLTAYGQKVK